MKNIKFSANLLTMVLTVIFGALTIDGLNIPGEATPGEIAKLFTEGATFWKLIGIFGINFANVLYHWIKTIISNPKQIWLFLHSVNWWVSFGNMLVAILLAFFPDVIIDTNTMLGIVNAVFDADWTLLAKLVFVNILIPIIKIFFKKKPLEIK